MSPKLKRNLNKVNRIIVKDPNDKSPILNSSHNEKKNNTIQKESNENENKEKIIKIVNIDNKKNHNIKNKNLSSDKKPLFKVKKQKLSEDEIQIQENDNQKKIEPITNQVDIKSEEESKQELSVEIKSNKEQIEDKISQISHQDNLKINDEWKENSWTEEDSNFLMPFEIKRLIESSSKSKEMILESISFPSGKDTLKILQDIKQISISSIEEIQNWFQRMINTERKLRDYDHKSNSWAIRKNYDYERFSYVKPLTKYNSSPYSKDLKMKSHKSKEYHNWSNYLKHYHNPELIHNNIEYSDKEDIEMSNNEAEQFKRHAHKNSKGEIIEYNPEEMSDEYSDSNSNKSNQCMILNHDSHYNYQIMNKDLMITGKKLPIYGWK